MQASKLDKQWWTGFQKGHNFTVENDILIVNIYDPPDYSDKKVEAELNPHTALGHELSHLLAGAFFFKGFDPSGAYLWKERIHDDFDPGRALFYECWVIHGQVLSDPNVDLTFKLEHYEKGRKFLGETFQILYQKHIPKKWLDRWDKLKEELNELGEFRKNLPIDPWQPLNFSKVKLGRLAK